MRDKSIAPYKLFYYAILGLPLGFIGVPLYLNLPKFYSDTTTLSLSTIGALLFFTRLIDGLLDPFIGLISDKYYLYKKQIIAVAAITLGISVFGLFQCPLIISDPTLVFWLSGFLISTYVSFSVLMINFYSNGLALSDKNSQTARISAWREGFILLGVLVASILPQILMVKTSEINAYIYFSYIFLGILTICAILFISNLILVVPKAANPYKKSFEHKTIIWLYVIFFLNTIAPSITSTLFLFFVEDVLKLKDLSGIFLLVYFVSAICAMPIWTQIGNKIDKKRGLLLSMLLAIFSFIWAYSLKDNDLIAFTTICIFSGIALGGDLVFLPALLSDELKAKNSTGGFEFGIWNFISKFTLAIGAGVSLPLLSYLGYTTNNLTYDSIWALSFTYSLLPCTFKLIAFLVLYFTLIKTRRG